MKRMEFRDGEKDVPDHVAALLLGVDTFQYTHDQAVRLSEQQLLKNRLNEAQKRLVDSHLRRGR